MPIYKTDRIQLESRQFKVSYITADVPNNTATTLLMQPVANANPDQINIVGLVVQDIGFQGTDYLAAPLTWTIASGKVVVTLNYGSAAGTYKVRFALFYKK